MKPEILVVDDEPDIRAMVRLILEDEGYAVREAENAETARDELTNKPPSLVILDIWMRKSDMDGLELQKWVRRYYPDMPAIMISGHGNIETAVQAMKDGAFDFVEKPFKSDQLLLLCARALANAKREVEHSELKRRSNLSEDLIGTSPAIVALKQTIAKVAPSNSRIFITGPSGAGKALLARNLHAQSARAEGRFIVVNCALLSPERALIDLFGSETGKDGKRVVGLFEQAHNGTLYFDEVCDLPLETQARLLRSLQDQGFRRLGGASDVELDVRLISASSRDVQSAMAQGKFREDLFYRLSVVPIAVPPLSRRREDIAALAKHFLKNRLKNDGQDGGQGGGGRKLEFAPSSLALLESYAWPGNITQLRNMIDWLVIMVNRDSKMIEPDDLPAEISGKMIGNTKGENTEDAQNTASLTLKEAREQFETQYLLSQLERFDGNIAKTAQFIGMERSALHRKLKNLDIQLKEGQLEETKDGEETT